MTLLDVLSLHAKPNALCAARANGSAQQLLLLKIHYFTVVSLVLISVSSDKCELSTMRAGIGKESSRTC